MIRRLASALGALVCLVPSSEASAAVLRVPEDYPTIPAAVDATVPGDSVLVGPGTWTDTITRVVQLGDVWFTITSCGFLKQGTAVIGTAGAEQTVVDPAASGPGFVNPFLLANQTGATTVLEGLTVTGAGTGALAIFAADAPGIVLRRCRVVNNNVGANFIVKASDADLVMEDCEVSFNQGNAAVLTENGDVEVRRCRFERNQGTALVTSGRTIGTGILLTVVDCSFIQNRDAENGGAVLGPGRPAIVERNLFLENVREGNPVDPGAGGLAIGDSWGVVRFNTFIADSSADIAGGMYVAGPLVPEITENTFYRCHADIFGAAVWMSSGNILFRSNLITHSTGGPAAANNDAILTGGCNDFFGNEGGDFFWWTPLPTDFFADPLYCDPTVLDLTLRAGSPCLPGGIPGCDQVGAYGQGCGAISVRQDTWSRVKSYYRQGGVR